MRDQKILVTGGAGSIGSELARQLNEENEVFIIDNNETALFDLIEAEEMQGLVADITNPDTILGVFEHFEPDIVFHCAALKHVTPSAWNPSFYVDTNIGGTVNVLYCAKKYGTKVINISTDKVVNPDSIMGATKKVAEIAVRDAGQISVRFGNVLGSRGSVLSIWQDQIDKDKPLTVTNDKMTRFFMTVEEACELLIKAADIGNPGEILIMDMGDPVNVLELAKDILKKSGKDLDIKMIGARPGENCFEELMTETESVKAIKKDKFYIIK